MHGTAFVAKISSWKFVPVVVLHGAETHIKEDIIRGLARKVLGEDEDDRLDLIRYAGKETDLKTVRDDLLTVSMFSSARMIVVDDADDFVTNHRAGLEEYFDKPSRVSLLVLAVKSWPKTTRLAKKLPDVGQDVDCGELAGAVLHRWLADQATERAAKQLSRDAAPLMVERAGQGLGLLSQEIDKLIAYVGDRDKIGVEDVRAVVGGWRAETTWEMLNAVRDNRPGEALAALDKLLAAGEPAPKLLGGINYVFRKLAYATERSRGGKPLRVAMKEAGVFPRDVDACEQYLRRIGRARAESILTLLSRADSNLKGGSRTSDRLQLEQLLLGLGGALPVP
ncbi:MAG: DNA polymerase III subunit delta [Planctomycetaceae bacterium]